VSGVEDKLVLCVFYKREFSYVTTMEQWNYNCSPYSSINSNSSIPVNPQLNQVNSFDGGRSFVNVPNYSAWDPRNCNGPYSEIREFPRHSLQAAPVNQDYHNEELTEQQKWLKLTQQRQIDQKFLNEFCKSRGQFSVAKQEPIIKICMYKELVIEAQKLMDELGRIDAIPASVEYNSIQAKRERLNFVMEQLEDPVAVAIVKKELDKRKRKREWLKRKKLNLAKKAEEAATRRIEMNREIDERREIIQQKHASVLRDLNIRREADLVLSEVHRKQNEAKRMAMLLQSLKELRRLRAESLKSRRGLYTTEEDNVRFNSTIDGLEKLIEKQTIIYGDEEKTLRAMMEMQQVKQPDNKRKREQIFTPKA